jgi:transposase
MRLQTILNRTDRIKRITYGKIRVHEFGESLQLSIRILPRRNSRPFCSRCGCRGPVHDKLTDLQYQHVPICGIAVVFLYAMRRVKCNRCGTTVKMVPWSEGKNRLTTCCLWIIASWTKRLSWTEVATIFRTSWDSVMQAIEHAVAWGLEHRDLTGSQAIVIDEIAWAKGSNRPANHTDQS